MPFEYEYPRPAISVDMVVLRNELDREVLLIQRRHPPFQDQWALPGGFLEIEETLEQAARRELQEETGLEAKSLRQVGAFSTVDRDPRTRVISVAFLVDPESLDGAAAADDAKSLAWFGLEQLPELAFDHLEILQLALAQLATEQG